MNEKADALNKANMRNKNKKLQDSTQDLLRSKMKDLQMLVEKQRND